MDGTLSRAVLLISGSAAIAAWLLVGETSSWLGVVVAVLSTAAAIFVARAQLRAAPPPETASALGRSQIEGALGREVFRARRYDRRFSAVLVSVAGLSSPDDEISAIERVELATRKLIRKTDEVGFWDARHVLLVLSESSAQDASHLLDRMRRAIKDDLRFGVTEYHDDDSIKNIVDRLEASLAENQRKSEPSAERAELESQTSHP